jgi:putative transcriptional regulator
MAWALYLVSLIFTKNSLYFLKGFVLCDMELLSVRWIEMKFKCRLRVILAEREMKHGDLADKAGVSRAQLSALINNRNLPTLPVAFNIAEVLELKIEDIWIKEQKK